MRQRILLLQRAVLLAALCFSLNNAGAKQTTTATVGAMLLSNMQQTGGHRPTLNMTNRVQVLQQGWAGHYNQLTVQGDRLVKLLLAVF